MRIGFANVYPFRPHVEHLVYLMKLVERAGHEVRALSCFGCCTDCHSRLFRRHGPLVEKTFCRLGGFETYPVGSIRRVDRSLRSDLPQDRLLAIADSSALSIARIETPAERDSDEVRRLRQKLASRVDIFYRNTRDWIEQEGLDGVVCFNGRMAAARAVTEACRSLDVPFVTTERSWLGHGIRLIPGDNCLALGPIRAMAQRFHELPLEHDQARLAGRHAANRFLQQNVLEWRLYNPDARSTEWPEGAGRMRVLVLPSSRHEMMGHPDWDAEWPEFTTPLDQLVETLGTGHESILLRCHPNWAESIGEYTGWRSEEHYTSWARSRGARWIPSEAPANTFDLIEEADLVVVNGGSAGVESALAGKPVICLGPSMYQDAGIAHHVHGPSDWASLEPALEDHDRAEVTRRALRYVYLRARRYPQYVDHVRAETTTRFRFYEGADAGRLTRLLEGGVLEPDETSVADSRAAEDEVVQALMDRRWEALADYEPAFLRREEVDVSRRPLFAWVGPLRERLPRGDRMLGSWS